jgi:hypothetical protein
MTKKQCCVNVMFYCGSGSDFGKVSVPVPVPVPVPAPVPDHMNRSGPLCTLQISNKFWLGGGRRWGVGGGEARGSGCITAPVPLRQKVADPEITVPVPQHCKIRRRLQRQCCGFGFDKSLRRLTFLEFRIPLNFRY